MYLSNSELKARARAQLGNKLFGSAWLYAAISLIIYSLITGLLNIVFKGSSENGSVSVSFGPVINYLVTGPLSVSLAYMFLKQCRDGQVMNLGDLLKGFRENFGENFLLGLLMSLFIALWSLLLIVPGIIKAYSYSMAYFIRVDHPEYGFRQCLDESRALMAGNKGRLFALDLSFLGWLILGALCLGIGACWAEAYHQAARAQFYQDLVNKDSGASSANVEY